MKKCINEEQYKKFATCYAHLNAIEAKYESESGIDTYLSKPITKQCEFNATLLAKIWTKNNRDIRTYLLDENDELLSFVAQRNFSWYKTLLHAPLGTLLHLKFKKSKNNTYYCVELMKITENFI